MYNHRLGKAHQRLWGSLAISIAIYNPVFKNWNI